jgi:YD repeat-containing protein
MLGVKAIMGKDPGLPMLPGALIGPPVPNVLIGGFPCPALGDMAQGKPLGGLKKALPKGKRKAPDRKHGEPLDGSNAAQREANGLECSGSHPIYLVTGENFDSYVDFAPGGLFEWRRHSTSARNGMDGPLGFGWRHFYQRTLRRRLHRATFVDWDGLYTEFGRFEPGESTTRANGYVLERFGPGHFRVRYHGQPHLEFAGGEFDDELRLTGVVQNDATLELSYDALGRLTALDERRAGRHHHFELDLDERGRICRLWQVDLPMEARPVLDEMAPDTWIAHAGFGSSLLDPALAPASEQRILRAAYCYSAGRNLERACDSLEGQAHYEYDAFHRLVKQTDARGYAYSYRYDVQGRCIRASGQDGLWWCPVQYFPDERSTRYTEGDNAT